MDVEIQVNNSTNPNARFVTWAPAPCRIRMTNPAGATGSTVSVKLTSVAAAGGGAVRFRAGTSGNFTNTLTLAVPTNGTSVNFFVAGKFLQPSTNRDDVTIEARDGTTLVGSVKLMVRIRQDANTLTPGERDRIVAAFATLNNQGMGRFADFRDMHTAVSDPQAHGAPGFLPWHRAYLLDLERELQAIDPGIALPYWRFDQPAPNLFHRDFIGVPDSSGNVQFNSTNPLRFWKTDGVTGIVRFPFFNTNTQPAFVLDEANTLGLGPDYVDFQNMEGDPHGNAHTSFSGFISSIPTAARDPLFFLLHCNVDRLWAKWQQTNGRFDPAVAESFVGDPNNPLGHNLADSMWPWNNDTMPPRPPTAPGGTLANSPCVNAPGNSPTVSQCLDYRGVIAALADMGFDYDDVP